MNPLSLLLFHPATDIHCEDSNNRSFFKQIWDHFNRGETANADLLNPVITAFLKYKLDAMLSVENLKLSRLKRHHFDDFIFNEIDLRSQAIKDDYNTFMLFPNFFLYCIK